MPDFKKCSSMSPWLLFYSKSIGPLVAGPMASRMAMKFAGKKDSNSDRKLVAKCRKLVKRADIRRRLTFTKLSSKRQQKIDARQVFCNFRSDAWILMYKLKLQLRLLKITQFITVVTSNDDNTNALSSFLEYGMHSQRAGEKKRKH